MDQSTYTDISGKTVTAARFDAVSEIATAKLEDMLGWPLDPGDWDNQYVELGKSQNQFGCFDLIDEVLADPDEVVGSYRIFTYHPRDVYIAIDPASTIHAVKLVRNNVTYRTLVDRRDYSPKWASGSQPFTKYLFTHRQFACLPIINRGYYCNHWQTDHTYQVAVDADWMFDELPVELNLVLSELITQSYDIKTDIKSESVTSHSYTKFDKEPLDVKYQSILTKYAGPNGSIKNRIT